MAGALALDIVADADDRALRCDDVVEAVLRVELLREKLWFREEGATAGSRIAATELAPLVTSIDRKPRGRKNFLS